MSPLPSAFLLGAPKCGTTSLYAHLARHPQANFPSVKEPGYFSRSQIVGLLHPYQASRPDYERLYARENAESLIACDGSTSYLRSAVALREIVATVAEPRCVAVVRDPVRLVESYHAFLLGAGWENVSDVVEAWSLQDTRSRGQQIPAAVRRPDVLQYRWVASLGAQVRAAAEILGDNLHVELMQDVLAPNSGALLRVQDHIGLSPMDLGPVPMENRATVPRFRVLDEFVKSPPAPLLRLRNKVKTLSGSSSLGIRRLYNRIGRKAEPYPVDPSFRLHLQDVFHEDVALLSDFLHRDLIQEYGWAARGNG